MKMKMGRTGQSNTKIYRAFRDMHRRCTDPRYHAFDKYAGKGIIVCERWSGPEGFQNFQDDMGEPASVKLSLDRIDNSAGYYPDNCRWATRNQQQRNRGLFKNSKVPFIGVYKTKLDILNKYRAHIFLNGESMHLGCFSDPVDAAHTYDVNALSLHGDAACTNESEGLYEKYTESLRKQERSE